MKDKGNMMTLLLVAGGGLALYWYLTNYGPTGAVSAGSVSWWNSWFGTGQAQPQPSAVTAPPTTILTSTPTPAPTPAPTALPPAAYVTVTGPVAADINNSLKATVMLQGYGQPVSLNVIPANVGQGAGLIWNGNGQDITSSFTADQQSQIAGAIINAAKLQGVTVAGMSGIVTTPYHQPGVNLSGFGEMPLSMSFGKGFGNGFRGRRVSTPPMKPVLN